MLVAVFAPVVEDFHLLQQRASDEHPSLPVVLIGHSMGGMIASRYAQLYGDSLACVVLSGPVLGRWAPLEPLLPLAEMPETPIDPSTLSRDPAVREVYVSDPLVWHRPFKRPTVEALARAVQTITAAGPVDSTPVLWLPRRGRPARAVRRQRHRLEDPGR